MRKPAGATATAAGLSAPVGRRVLLQNSVVFALAASSLTARPLPAQAVAAGPPLPEAFLLPMGDFVSATSAAGATKYPDGFTLYLARFLLAFDGPSARWYEGVSAGLPSSWGRDTASRKLSEDLASFAGALQYRLVPLASAGARGSDALWSTLQSAYGMQPGAKAQLALLFSLLGPDQQPVERISRAIQTSGGGGLAGAAAGAAAGPAVSATGPAAGGTVAVEGGEPEAAVVTTALDALLSSPSALLPASVLPQWVTSSTTASGGYHRLPGSLATALVPEDLREESVLGRLGKPLGRERPLDAGTYNLFALSGGLGCAATHLTVVPLDVVKTRIQTRPGYYAGFGQALSAIREEEGLRMLFQGAGATGAGYFAYGVTVYPG